MARLGLQRQAETEIALEFGSDLGAISDGSPVVRDEHGSFVQGLHRADLAGVKSLNQRRDDAFGFSGERIGLGHPGLLSCWLSPCQWRALMACRPPAPASLGYGRPLRVQMPVGPSPAGLFPRSPGGLRRNRSMPRSCQAVLDWA